MGGLSQIDKQIALVGKLVKKGYYKIQEIGRFLVEKGYNDLLPMLKDAYRRFKKEFELSNEIKNSLSNDREIEEYNPEGRTGKPAKGMEGGGGVVGGSTPSGSVGGTFRARPPIRIADDKNLPNP